MNHITQEQSIALAKDKGALVENWMTNPPRAGLLYATPEQMHALCNAAIEWYIAQKAAKMPLTDEQIDEAINAEWATSRGNTLGWLSAQRKFARAIEKAHGIKEPKV